MKKKAVKNPMVGSNVIVRANVAGVHAGTVVSIKGDTVILKNARRLWRVYTRDKSGSISDVAANGLKEGAEHSIGAVLPRVCIINPQGFELGVPVVSSTRIACHAGTFWHTAVMSFDKRAHLSGRVRL